MMKNVYGIRDVKAGVFSYPHFEVTHGQAIRGFGDAVRNTKSPFNAHPEDYSLYHLGEFDEVQGTLVSLKVPVLLSSAVEHKSVDNAPVNGAKPEVVNVR
jgi:hypothetical protein